MVKSIVIIADLVQLAERNEQDQKVIVEAVKRWLTLHRKWLLIFDNVDQDVTAFYPLSAQQERNTRNGW